MYPNQEKLQLLADDEDYASIDEMLEMASMDGVAPAICTEKWCDHMTHLDRTAPANALAARRAPRSRAACCSLASSKEVV